ncbi:ATP-binding protein [Dactylosporangium salmoneum]|uniref:Histidine kinase/HSP90-like ATPase domain-containing protein n=1 Tax=Dactylosporangium salmoneum TaxID=53361 RepID=A0ABP5V8P0_9ACTN
MVTELATNTLRYTAGGGTLHLWAAGGSLICQVNDAGHLTGPLAGRRPAPPDQPGGRGLLLTHQLCDLVETFSAPGETAIRVHLHR